MDMRTGVKYCSKICCAYTAKEAIITKEHDPDVETYIFHTQLKTYGKGFWEYFQRAKEVGVKYIRGRPAEIKEDPKTKDLVIEYEDLDTSKHGEIRVDLVVLSTAIIPSKGNEELAKILGIELDECGFFKEKEPFSSPLETKVEGIFLCGCCMGPRDIPESSSEASAAAAKAVSSIIRAKGVKYGS
jgi:heterodisulfide reductase subunit A